MTPSFSGRIALMCAGVRPIIRLASVPTATARPSCSRIATTDGSDSTMPSPRTYTNVLAVPRSTAMSRLRKLELNRAIERPHASSQRPPVGIATKP